MIFLYIPRSETREARGSSTDAGFTPNNEARGRGNHRASEKGQDPSTDAGSRAYRASNRGDDEKTPSPGLDFGPEDNSEADAQQHPEEQFEEGVI